MQKNQVRNRRRILCVFARYSRVFGTFHHAYQFFPDAVAFMLPQGILTVAAYLPEEWEVRFFDENVEVPSDEDYQWADAVFASGMHVQRNRLESIAARAHQFGKIAAIGGPSVSGCPEYYPGFDLLHVGELGDATDELIAYLDRTTERPPQQIVFTTSERLPLNDFPIPAYSLADISKYFILTIQWSSGCPFACEFCDIPELYGRKPRLKSPERLIAELDVILSRDPATAVYFVDDNLIGNKKAAKELLPHLIEWQKKNGYRLRFVGECTLNVAQDVELLSLMREAYITDLYFGIESPDESTLKGIDKSQNIRMPILEAVKLINSYGIELHAGFILGMDPDGFDTADKITRFVELANIPMVAFNVIFALPRTPLWRRLEAEGRLIPEADFEDSNVVFKLPLDEVMRQWHQVTDDAYRPEAVYTRYEHNITHTYPYRKKPPLTRYRVSWKMLRIAGYSLAMIFREIGLKSTYKAAFWKLAVKLLLTGRIDHLIYIASIAHHLILYGEDVRNGKSKACFYTPKVVEETESASPALVSIGGAKV